MNNILSVKDLTKTYITGGGFGKKREIQVLKGVSLDIKRGSTFGLLGPSGCGKTTLAKIILGLEKMTSGNVIIDGQDISRLGRKDLQKLRSKVQVVFQDPYSSLDPRMKVREILQEPFVIHKIKHSETKLKKLMSLVGLSNSLLDRYPHEFSGGQRQRIAIARALALDPKLLVADEPVSSLDVSIQAQILNLLKDIRREYNLSMLFISHDFAVADFLCDEVAVLYKGTIADKGPSGEVFKNPESEETKQLLNAVLPLSRAANPK